MSTLSLNGKTPQTKSAAFVAENATLVGDVVLEKAASIWYGAVLRADTGRIFVGEGSNIQDNAVLHTGPELDVVVGKNVSVGHGAIVHGCTVSDDALIGMHATVLNGARIGRGAVVAAGALVPAKMEVPDGMLAIGIPAKIRGPVSEEMKAANLANAENYRQLGAVHAAAQDAQKG